MILQIKISNALNLPIALFARSKAWVCGRLLVRIAGSNPPGDIDVCLLWVLYVVRYRSLRWADHPSRGGLPSVVCLIICGCVCVCNRENSTVRRPWSIRACCVMGRGPFKYVLLSVCFYRSAQQWGLLCWV